MLHSKVYHKSRYTAAVICKVHSGYGCVQARSSLSIRCTIPRKQGARIGFGGGQFNRFLMPMHKCALSCCSSLQRWSVVLHLILHYEPQNIYLGNGDMKRLMVLELH